MRGAPKTHGHNPRRACFDFVEKLEHEIEHGELVRTFTDLGLPVNLLRRWRQGSVVRLDYAWLVAQALGVSLEYLADDGRTEKGPPAAPGVPTTAAKIPNGHPSSGPKKRASHNDISVRG